MPSAKPAIATGDIPTFRALYAPADEGLAAALLSAAGRLDDAEARIDQRATRLVQAIRARVGGLGGVAAPGAGAPRRRSRCQDT